MTSDQKFAALIAILIRRGVILDSLSGDPNPSPDWSQRAAKDLKDLEGAYAAISAIEVE